jgi:hypothetical protein
MKKHSDTGRHAKKIKTKVDAKGKLSSTRKRRQRPSTSKQGRKSWKRRPRRVKK